MPIQTGGGAPTNVPASDYWRSWLEVAEAVPPAHGGLRTAEAEGDRQRDDRIYQDHPEEPQSAFWRRHVTIGVALQSLGALGVLAYVLAGPTAQHRTALIVLDLASLTAGLTVTWWLGLRLVVTKLRESFFFGWSVSTILFVAAAAGLDGGTKSPLSYLLVLPLLFAGLAYEPKVVTWLAALDVACAAAIGFVGSERQSAATLVLVLATAIAGILTVAGALNRARLTRQLVELAAMDGLTRCLAHRAFHRRLAYEVERARRYSRTFGLVMVDVDNLKRLNDTFGHGAGDDALRAVAAGLKAAGRASDVVGRLGGDEFAVLLPEVDESHIASLSDRLRSVVSGYCGDLPVTLSLGSTVWSGPLDTARDMLHRADAALYSAKHAGRDRSVKWESPEPRVETATTYAARTSTPSDA
jgi:diguanylate cyclase (GGDEF)-like protein